MQRSLLLQVHFLDGRYHGAGAWPPSPARVFQALVASAGPQQRLPDDVVEALRWLEGLAPPVIHAPVARAGQRVQTYVPHNDLDTAGGDPRAVESIRVGKVVAPHLFDARVPTSYVWRFGVDAVAEGHASRICELSAGLYQLGRGCDAAWARAHVLSWFDAMELLRTAEGRMLRPSVSPRSEAVYEGGAMFDCAVVGSLDSLIARHCASAERFGVDRTGRKATQTFSQLPPPLFMAVRYGSAHTRILFELRSPDPTGGYVHVRLASAAGLVRRIRDAAVERLSRAIPDRRVDIENAWIGRPVDGRAIAAEKRIRIVPLPSIGHEHVDRGIRRVLLDIPSECPLAVEDVCWALSGLALSDADTGEVDAVIAAAENTEMLGHYGMGAGPHRTWRTVTPMALGSAQDLGSADAAKWANAIGDALRHEGTRARAVEVLAQRTPFERHGVEASQFVSGTRFSEETLWHVEVTLDRAIRGPLVLGDGRYLGLGVLTPVRDEQGLLCYRVMGGLAEGVRPGGIAQALRRAVMARCAGLRDGKLDGYVHGHEGSGPMRRGPHLHFQFDPERRLLWIMAPHVVDRRKASARERGQWADVVRAMEEFSQLLAGDAGALDLRAEVVDGVRDPLLVSCRMWETVVPYAANRHRDAGSAYAALAEDLQQSLHDAGFPSASIEVLQCRGNRDGLSGHVRMTFPVAIAGPVLLGRGRFVGGGLFRAIA